MTDTFTDIAIRWDEERSAGDWHITADGELLTTDGLETAVFVSLFTDARARPDDKLPLGETDRRGWWGNALGDPIGSLLWLLRRAKREPETLRRAKTMIERALAWIIEDGLAARIDVATRWGSRTGMSADITIHQANGGRAALRADWAWSRT